MNKASSALVLVAAFVLPLQAIGSSEVNAHVKSFGTYGNGNVWIVLDAAIDEPGCTGPYIELPANGAANKVVLATASLAVATASLAVATGSAVLVRTDGCLDAASTFTGARPAYFGINKP